MIASPRRTSARAMMRSTLVSCGSSKISAKIGAAAKQTRYRPQAMSGEKTETDAAALRRSPRWTIRAAPMPDSWATCAMASIASARAATPKSSGASRRASTSIVRNDSPWVPPKPSTAQAEPRMILVSSSSCFGSASVMERPRENRRLRAGAGPRPRSFPSRRDGAAPCPRGVLTSRKSRCPRRSERGRSRGSARGAPGS